jgi:hypothetical protein
LGLQETVRDLPGICQEIIQQWVPYGSISFPIAKWWISLWNIVEQREITNINHHKSKFPIEAAQQGFPPSDSMAERPAEARANQDLGMAPDLLDHIGVELPHRLTRVVSAGYEIYG